MPLATLLCAGLLGWSEPSVPPDPDVNAAYRQIEASSGRTTDDQVRLALWCESHGLTAERVRHLALAVLADPTNATARGLAGLVARDGRWVVPVAVEAGIQTDPATSALLAEYDQRRSQTPYTADDQWALGVWASDQGLKDQARAHFTAVTRLDPNRDQAWKRLGYKKYAGKWTTHERIVAEQAEADAQKRADRRWRPRLERWKGMLNDPSSAVKAHAALAAVIDPRAVRAVEVVFGDGTRSSELVAVRLLGQLDGGPASVALAGLAVRSESPEVRRAAAETLVQRDPREFISHLTRLVQTPWKYEVRQLAGPEGRGELFVAGERYNIRRIYTPPPLSAAILAGSRPVDTPGSIQPGLRRRATGRDSVSPPAPPTRSKLATVDTTDPQVRRDLETLAGNVQVARQELVANLRSIEQANAAIRTNNDKILPILTRITGQTQGDNHEAWVRWQDDQAGYASPSSSTAKPTYTELANLDYQDYSPVPPRSGECFAAGTPVRTIVGARPIESLQRGDLVLVQDTTSGALSYQPILTAFANPPIATVRVTLGTETIVATKTHRFWKAGRGWAMARDLKPGDSLRVLGGVGTVGAVEPNPVTPVFNLEVADGRTFFVGQVAALVHDNTLVEITPEPFDAPSKLVPPTAIVAR